MTLAHEHSPILQRMSSFPHLKGKKGKERAYALIERFQAGQKAVLTLMSANRNTLFDAAMTFSSNGDELTPYMRWQRAASAFLHAIRHHRPDRTQDRKVRRRQWRAFAAKTIETRFRIAASEPLSQFANLDFDTIADTLGPMIRLKPSEELRLLKQARIGMHAIDDLMVRNTRLVLKVASTSTYGDEHIGDRVSDGMIGFHHAMTKFDTSTGFAVSTYGGQWIKQAIHRAGQDTRLPIRIPVNKLDRRMALQRVIYDREKAGLPIDPDSLAVAMNERHKAARMRVRERERRRAKLLGVKPRPERKGKKKAKARDDRNGPFTAEVIVQLLEVPIERPMSLDRQVIDGDSDGMSWHDVMPDAKTQDRDMDQQDHCVTLVRSVMADLTSIQRAIVQRRFGLDGMDEETLLEVGRRYNVSRERVRQIQAATLKLMRQRILTRATKEDSELLQLMLPKDRD